MASLRVARLGWLSRQAKRPLHVGWHRTRQIRQRPSNVKSTIRKARSSPTQTWIALGKNGRYLQLRSFTFFALDTWSLLRTVLNSASWLCQSGDSDAAACCYRDVGPKGPNNKHRLEEHLWHVGSTTSTVASLRVARLGWLPSQANLPLFFFFFYAHTFLVKVFAPPISKHNWLTGCQLGQTFAIQSVQLLPEKQEVKKYVPKCLSEPELEEQRRQVIPMMLNLPRSPQTPAGLRLTKSIRSVASITVRPET